MEVVSRTGALAGSGDFTATSVLVPIVSRTANLTGLGAFSAVISVVVPGQGESYGVIRWRFREPITGDSVIVPINPREMSSPTAARNMNWAWGSTPGAVMRGIDNAPQQSEWTFTGVLLTKSHYDLLLAWTKRLEILHIRDHLGRTFEVVIQKFDPIERLPTAHRDWRADYTMTCMLLGQVS